MTTPEFAAEGLPQKIIGLHTLFEAHRVAYAFGGAIALAYHAEPRATDDIDINILLDATRAGYVIDALGECFEIEDSTAQVQRIATQDQTRLMWGSTYVDLFFMDTPFHESLASRIQRVAFGSFDIAIISAEDLVVCKSIFNRPKDWVDIASISAVQGLSSTTPTSLVGSGRSSATSPRSSDASRTCAASSDRQRWVQHPIQAILTGYTAQVAAPRRYRLGD